MCLIFLSVNNHPKYRLIISANRDEFYQRKTAPASFWEDQPDILAGRDLEAGGTWMGVSRGGRISMVTNYRDPKNIDPNAPSRGHLVSDFLVSDEDPDSYLKDLVEKGANYNGFNLIVGELDNLSYYSNYDTKIKKLTPGIYGLSNHLLDTPWPKVERGKMKFAELIKSSNVNADQLLDLMYDEERASDEKLPDTGIGLERERALSSMFIKTPNYGSRSSTVLLLEKTGRIAFTERVYDLNTFAFQTNAFELVPKSAKPRLT